MMEVLNNFSNSSIKFKDPQLIFQSFQDTIQGNEKHINYVFFGVNYMEYHKDLIIDSVFLESEKVEIITNVSILQGTLKKVEFTPKETGNYSIYGKLVFKLPDGTFRKVPFQKSFVVIGE